MKTEESDGKLKKKRDVVQLPPIFSCKYPLIGDGVGSKEHLVSACVIASVISTSIVWNEAMVDG